MFWTIALSFARGRRLANGISTDCTTADYTLLCFCGCRLLTRGCSERGRRSDETHHSALVNLGKRGLVRLQMKCPGPQFMSCPFSFLQYFAAGVNHPLRPCGCNAKCIVVSIVPDTVISSRAVAIKHRPSNMPPSSSKRRLQRFFVTCPNLFVCFLSLYFRIEQW